MGSWFSSTATAGANASTALPSTPAPELTKDQLELALKYAVFASAAYCDTDEEVIKNLSPYKDGKLKKADFRRVVHTGTLWQLPVSGVKATTDTEVLAVRVPGDEGQEDEMVIAFRGTETSGASGRADMLTDMFALQTPIANMDGFPPEKHSKEVKVHRGFLQSFNDVVQPTEDGAHDALRSIRDELFGKGVIPSRVVVTGHSLGAALSTLGAFWVKSASPKTEVWCYPFASPRLGNKEFKELFEKTVDKTFRFTHKSDVVCAVPASSMWKHVQQSVLLLDPKKTTFGLTVAPVAPGCTYKAVLADRPRSIANTSVTDHSMVLYIKALEDCLKAFPAEGMAAA